MVAFERSRPVASMSRVRSRAVAGEGESACPSQGSYWAESRQLSAGFLFVLIPLVLYQVVIVQFGSPIRNTAEYWMTNNLYALLGRDTLKVLNFALIVFFVIALCRPRDGSVFHFKVLVGMLGESLLYAAALHLTVNVVTTSILERASQLLSVLGPSRDYVLSIGAGVYEEVLFRLVVMSGLLGLLVVTGRVPLVYTAAFAAVLAGVLLALVHFVFPLGTAATRDSLVLRLTASILFALVIALVVNLMGRPRAASVGLAILASALAFTLAHHVGPLGESIRPYNFLYRMVAGVILGGLFAVRGIGVAVGTHVMYNVLVLSMAA